MTGLALELNIKAKKSCGATPSGSPIQNVVVANGLSLYVSRAKQENTHPL
jgi:hypothetical protein